MRRTRRLVLQLLPLLALWALASADAGLYTLVIALISFMAWVLSVSVALLLSWLVRVAEREGPAPETLIEAADNAVTLALIASGITVAAGFAAARVLGVLPPVGPVLLAFLGWALALVGVPALSWLGTTRRVWLPMVERRP